MPGLGSIPVLGALFRSSGFKRGQTELVIIVTPIVVKPGGATRKVATPVDEFRPPNDFERILLGRFQGQGKADQVKNRVGRRQLQGASGFVFK